MNLIKKTLSLFMAVVIAFSVLIPASARTQAEDFKIEAADLISKEDYKAMLLKLGRPAITTEEFLNFTESINLAFRFFTGRAFVPQEHFNVTVDAFIQSLSDHILENSGFDVAALATNLPDINNIAELTVKVLKIDTEEFRKMMYEKSDELYDSGDTIMSYLYHFLGAYFSIIELCEIYSVQTEENPDVYEIIMNLHFKDGEVEEFHPGLYINTVTGECTNIDNSGIVGSGFNFSITEMMTYATVDAWMRGFGFCLFYDLAASSMPYIWNYNTRRFKFDYNGLEYMIQIWKGNYLVANGGEVGLYCREAEKFGTYYNCANDEQMLKMSMQIYAGDELLVDQEPQLHWWVNGFHINGTKYLPASLTLKSTIEMHDEEMLEAFCEAIDKNIMNDVTYSVDGLTVTLEW